MGESEDDCSDKESSTAKELNSQKKEKHINNSVKEVASYSTTKTGIKKPATQMTNHDEMNGASHTNDSISSSKDDQVRRSKGTVTNKTSSMVLRDSGHTIPLDDVVHVLSWCGCINRPYNWIA